LPSFGKSLHEYLALSSNDGPVPASASSSNVGSEEEFCYQAELDWTELICDDGTYTYDPVTDVWESEPGGTGDGAYRYPVGEEWEIYYWELDFHCDMEYYWTEYDCLSVWSGGPANGGWETGNGIPPDDDEFYDDCLPYPGSSSQMWTAVYGDTVAGPTPYVCEGANTSSCLHNKPGTYAGAMSVAWVGRHTAILQQYDDSSRLITELYNVPIPRNRDTIGIHVSASQTYFQGGAVSGYKWVWLSASSGQSGSIAGTVSAAINERYMKPNYYYFAESNYYISSILQGLGMTMTWKEAWALTGWGITPLLCACPAACAFPPNFPPGGFVQPDGPVF
jgi:hypothetical protein